MKKLLLILGLLIHLVLNAQNTFNKVYYYFGDSIQSSSKIKSISIIDSNLYMGVDAISDSLLYTTYLVKTDIYGNKEKQSIRFGTDSTAYFISPGSGMFVDNDSDIIIGGGFIHNEWGGFIIKFNKNLDTLWSRHYLLPDSVVNFACDTPRHRFEAFNLILDGNYIIAGSYFLNCLNYSENKRAYLQKLDTSGNTIWRKIYSDISHIYNIINSDDSGFYFVGRKNNSFKLFKTDKFGNIEWEDTYATIANPIPPTRVARLDSNNLVIASCYWRDFSMDERSLVVSKYNIENKNIVWEDTFHFFYDVITNGLHQNFELKILPNKDIIIASTVGAYNWDSLSGGLHAGLFRLNQNGDSLWAHNYHAKLIDEFNQINDFVITDDGGFLLAGYHSPTNMNYNPGAWLLKTDSMGNAPNMHTAGFEGLKFESSMLNVFPNPASDFVSIEFNSQKTKISSYKIYNSQGKLLLSENLMANDFTINIKSLSPGFYIVKLVSNKQQIYITKLLKE